MIKITCDRCGGEMDKDGLIGYISWCFKEGLDGDLGANDLEGECFCERCMDEIRAMINFPTKWEQPKEKRKYETPVIVEETKNGKERKKPTKISKEKGEAILELKARGFKLKEIAEELEMDPVQVKNWLYYHKEKE